MASRIALNTLKALGKYSVVLPCHILAHFNSPTPRGAECRSGYPCVCLPVLLDDEKDEVTPSIQSFDEL